eukprot:gb/GFBE01050890.1/.p1 GENE.gb/GFBE01050890.1/~~gb/GFBE01050890.1/.p1  ORF type:complete len:335 (+),score=59.90 gb/GFBE01050890.1/:1-1005(+)
MLEEVLEKFSTQDLLALGSVAAVVVACVACLPLCLLFVLTTGFGPRCLQSICSHFLRWRAKPKTWSCTEIAPKLFLGSLPRSMAHLEELKAKGIGAVVTLNEPWELALSVKFVRDDCGFALLHLSTPDFFAPTQGDIEAAVDFIDKHIEQGVGVYVHCNGGKGRSAVCVLCYLIRVRGMTPAAAFGMVRSKRTIASMQGKLGLHKQWRAVKRFASKQHRKYVSDGPVRAFDVPGESKVWGASAENGPKGDRRVAPLPAQELDPEPVPAAQAQPASAAVGAPQPPQSAASTQAVPASADAAAARKSQESPDADLDVVPSKQAQQQAASQEPQLLE